MKDQVKSSITLPAQELREVKRLKKRLGAKSYVEVIRRSISCLREDLDRQELRKGYQLAAAKVLPTIRDEIDELDHLSGEGLPSE